MNVLEPASIPIFLTIAALVMTVSVLLSRVSDKAGVPVFLLFLLLGVILGGRASRVTFENYRDCFVFGNVALALILFDGGLNTPFDRVREGIAPAAVLASLGVLGTAGLVALFAGLFGFSTAKACLLGVIVAPTDAAAVFSIVRSGGLQLKKRMAVILELESGLNDPMAVILTITLTESLVAGRGVAPAALLEIPLALAIGAIAGVVVGYGGRWLLAHAQLPAGGLYPVLTLSVAFFAFGLSEIAKGSGFLSAYVAAVTIGNGPMPYRGGILRVHDSAAWLCQIAMYLLLGLLIVPAEMLKVAPAGIALGLVLAFVARPAIVALCLLPFGYKIREIGYLGWVGLRGAVPIVLATYPVLAGTEGAQVLFNIVFFIVVVNTLVPGATVRWATAWLGLGLAERSAPPALLDIVSTRILTGSEIVSFSVDSSTAGCGAAISDLPFPPESAAILLIRNQQLVAPRGSTVLAPGDHVYVLCRREDRPLVYLIFGKAESD